jgi:hypothetical protein
VVDFLRGLLDEAPLRKVAFGTEGGLFADRLGIPTVVCGPGSPLVSLPPYIVVAETHPLARQNAVALEELTDQPLVLLELPLSRGYFLAVYTASLWRLSVR